MNETNFHELNATQFKSNYMNKDMNAKEHIPTVVWSTINNVKQECYKQRLYYAQSRSRPTGCPIWSQE